MTNRLDSVSAPQSISPAVSPSFGGSRDVSLWPLSLSSRWVIWLAVAIPYLLLAAGNAWDLQLLFPEMSFGQRVSGAFTVGFPLMTVAVISVWAVVAKRLGLTLSPVLAGLIWLVGSAWLAASVHLASSISPTSIPGWMFDSGAFISRQFSFGMVPVLFGLSYLSLTGGRVGVPRALLIAGIAGVAAVGAMMALSMVGSLLRAVEVFAIVGSVLLIPAISMMIGAMIRVCMECYASVRTTSAAGIVSLMGVVCLILPLVGLWLNSIITFPSDFQTPGVWIFAVVNGVALMLPAYRNPILHRAIWLLQCACFSFTLYFFLVFLPILPWAPLAMVFLGAGILILVPTGVFVVHLWRLCDGWREARGRSRGFAIGLAGLAAFALIPGFLMIQAHRDKADLDRAVEYFQSPDYAVDSRFPGSPKSAARMLVKIQHLRAGVQLPIIDDYYQRVVLGGLILPEKFVAGLHEKLTGKDIPVAKPGVLSGRVGGFRGRPGDVVEPPNPEMLQRVQRSTVMIGSGTAETTLRLTFENPLEGNAEFKAKMALADGVYVTGYRLKMGDEWVDGRLFDEKTATWLYDRIRLEVLPRDPGLLRVSAAGDLSLSVFPVAGKEKRVTEIVMIHPAMDRTPVTLVGGQVLQIDESVPIENRKEALLTFSKLGARVAIPEGLLPAPIRRKPVALLILAHTAQAPLSVSRIQESRSLLEVAGIPTMTFAANFETEEIGDGAPSILARGAWDGPRSVMSALNAFASRNDPAQVYPVVILCGSEAPGADLFRGTAAELRLRELAPENPQILSALTNPSPELVNGVTGGVWVFRLGDQIAVSASRSSIVSVLFPGVPASTDPALQVLDGGKDEWVPVPATVGDNAGYVVAVEAGLWGRERVMQPHRFAGALGNWLGAAKEYGVLVPGLAFIAAETPAQWTTLERKEAERAKKDGAFDIEERSEAIPEPSTILLIALGALAIGYRLWFSKRPGGFRM